MCIIAPIECLTGEPWSICFRLFIVATGCPSERQPRQTVVTGDCARIQDETTESSAWFFYRARCKHRLILIYTVRRNHGFTSITNKEQYLTEISIISFYGNFITCVMARVLAEVKAFTSI